MKRALTILLLITFVYNFLGTGFVYNVWLYSIKENVKEQIERGIDGERTIVKVPKSWSENPPENFKWHEDQEFEYRGQMYDIIRQETRGNEIWYYCYWDEAETKLLNNLSKYVSNYLHQHPQKNQKTSFLSTYLDKVFLLFHLGGLLTPSEVEGPFSIQDLSTSNLILDVDDPPPQTAMSSLLLRLAF